MKKCCICCQEKPVTEFYKSNTRYYQRECKVCCKLRKRAWHRTEGGKLSSANTKLKSRFGITLDEFNSLLKQQDSKCLICGVENSCNGHRLAVDHDHKTGAIRGLLCKACNVALGNLQDNPALCERAAKYLRSYTNV